MQEAYIVSALRTPVAKARGAFKHVGPDNLLAHVIRSVMQQAPKLPGECVDDVIIGCAMPEAEQGMNVARIGLLLAGLPNSVPGMTINRFCSSGLQTIALGVERIRAGHADVIIAGGTESMTSVPLGGNKLVANPAYFEREENIAIAYGMGLTAELVASKWEITREAQDRFALKSHEKALAARERGDFNNEIATLTVHNHFPNLKTGKIILQERVVAADEGPRAGSSIAALAKLPSVFKLGGSVTAGNSSQISDGAAAVLIVSEKMLQRYQLTPMAKLISFEVAGVAPEHMGIGPIAAIPKALSKANLRQDQIDWIELNEAFAAQSLAVIKDVKLDPTKVNPLGGAIALGHPLGATGAIRTCTLLHGLKRTKQRYGMVTMCIGTGMGAAGVFEVL